jgi:hypothetical protein
MLLFIGGVFFVVGIEVPPTDLKISEVLVVRNEPDLGLCPAHKRSH